ncbi:MAG: SMC family ATPase [Methanobrevibacter sp.]|nr:SMC family ATPase [Methanobrevibacter sp.]
MIFNKLELKNFKSHVNTTLDFNHGISLIVGENGAGKSSIFEAITFALFKESLVNNSDLVRTNKGTSDKMEMEVKLTFQAGGIDYRIERSITKKGDNTKAGARLIRIRNDSEEIVAQGVRQVDEEIELILNMNSKTFLNAIHIRQGEISDLIDEKPANRKKLIGQLLRIDDLEKAYNEMPKVTKDYELLSERLDFKIEPEEELNSQLEDLTNEHNVISEQNVKLNTDLETLKKDNEAKTTEKERLDKQQTDLKELNVKLESENKLLETLNKTKEDLTNKLTEVLSNEEKMEELRPFCNKLQVFSDFKESLFKFNTLKKDEASKNETIEKINEYKQTLEDKKESHDMYVEIDGELKELTQNQTQIASEIKLIDEFEAKRKKAQTDIQSKNTLLEKVMTDSKDVLDDSEIDFDEIKLSELSDIVNSLIDSTKSEIKETDEKIKDNTILISSLQQEIKTSKKPLLEIRKVENKCPTCQSDITPDKKDQLINTYEVTINENTTKISELNDLNKSLSEEKSSKENDLKVYDNLKNEINKNIRIPEEIDNLTAEIEDLTKKIEELTAKRQTLEEITKSIEEKTVEFKNLEEDYKTYIDAQTLLNNQEDEEKLKSELTIITQSINEIEEKLNELIKAESELSIDIPEDELNKHIQKLTEKNAQFNQLEGSVKYKEEYETKIKANEAEIQTKSTEIDTIAKKIESCDYDEKTHQDIIKQTEDLAKRLSEIGTVIAVNQTNLKNNEEKTKELEAKITENDKYIAEFNAVNDYLDLLDDFRDYYGKNGIQNDLRSQSKPLIQKYTREFFDKFNFNYSDLLLSDEYDISIYGPDGKVKLGMVSGGEKIAIALSLRLAITQVMSHGNIETILLDEPTIHLDSFRRKELINVLRSMSIIPQMIIVTHDSELESAADTLIKIEKEDGISRVVDDS